MTNYQSIVRQIERCGQFLMLCLRELIDLEVFLEGFGGCNNDFCVARATSWSMRNQPSVNTAADMRKIFKCGGWKWCPLPANSNFALALIDPGSAAAAAAEAPFRTLKISAWATWKCHLEIYDPRAPIYPPYLPPKLAYEYINPQLVGKQTEFNFRSSRGPVSLWLTVNDEVRLMKSPYWRFPAGINQMKISSVFASTVVVVVVG